MYYFIIVLQVLTWKTQFSQNEGLSSAKVSPFCVHFLSLLSSGKRQTLKWSLLLYFVLLKNGYLHFYVKKWSLMNYLLKIRFLYFACFGRYFGQISDSMYVYIEGFSTIIVVGIVIDATQMVLGKSLKYRGIETFSSRIFSKITTSIIIYHNIHILHIPLLFRLLDSSISWDLFLQIELKKYKSFWWVFIHIIRYKLL